MAKISQQLIETGTARGAKLDKGTLRIYTSHLASHPLEDVILALEKLAEMKRQEYESPMPEVGALISLVEVCTIARTNRDAVREYFQQQQCPKCRGVVGMMRRVGEQFRTWCQPCRAYRKIVPEDLALTEAQWRKLCAELEIIYTDWVKRGRNPRECVDPQFDRALVMDDSEAA